MNEGRLLSAFLFYSNATHLSIDLRTTHFISLLFIGLFACLQASTQSIYAQDSNSVNTILKKPRVFTPLQTITGDTVTKDTTIKNEQIIPGSRNQFSPEQDSAYYRMMRLGIAPGTLAQLHAKIISLGIAMRREQEKENPFAIALRNLDLPKEYYQPRSEDIVQRQEMIARSQAIPTGRPGGLGAGLSIGLNDIGVFLGISEDVSPIINYAVDYTMNVKVVIYSTAAREVAMMFEGLQNPGKYQLTWNGRDDKGRPMPSGDYVAEVRLGDDRFVRKRITIP
jgi:hypothetical protein